MATSNRDRIGRMFEIAGPAFELFLTRVLADEIVEGGAWVDLVKLRDTRKGVDTSKKEYSSADPQTQLRMLTENIPHQIKPGWYPFDGHLSHAQKAWANELRECRDAFSHFKPFTDDDTYRALDTCERLLVAIDAPNEAKSVGEMRLDLRRITSQKSDRKIVKQALHVEGAGLKPWREVVRPHADVISGNFNAAEFAANLYKVSVGAGDLSSDYADPVEFFARTYVTAGLEKLITGAIKRLAGNNNASPVINLQTNFGGGKTHSMLALWHLAGGRPLTAFGQETQELLAEAGYDAIPAGVNRVAIVGTELSASGSEPKPDGTQVRTIWGELAWQLGGADGYAMIAEDDLNGTNPGSRLRELLAAYAPAVILIDEWVAYARQLYGRDDTLAGGSFETQFTFAQSLTEAAQGTPGVLLAISIPASDAIDEQQRAVEEEVGGAHGFATLSALQNVVGRTAESWQPASSHEAYHIVKRRLFTEPDADAVAHIDHTAREFAKLYKERHADLFPADARTQAYLSRIHATYPIHPELFDRLYLDWSTLDRFQRTRGVLRLMSVVIHALWNADDNAPMIMPGSIPLDAADVNAELTYYLHDQWKAIIDSDVDGEDSEPVRIDSELPIYGARSMTRRMARAVFVGAAPTIGTAHKGIETQRALLGVAVPGDKVANFDQVINKLADRATYFYSSGGTLWYDLHANITRRAKDQADSLKVEDVWAEVERRLGTQKAMRGPFAQVNVCPPDSAAIPDDDRVALVILAPSVPHSRGKASPARTFAQQATSTRGTANRTNRNMVVFVAGDAARLDEVLQSARQYLGWRSVLDATADLDLTQNQRQQAADQVAKHERTLNDRIALAYQWILAPAQPVPGEPFVIEESKAEGQADSLADRVGRKLGTAGQLVTEIAPSSIRMYIDSKVPTVWADGHVEASRLWRLFAEHPYMPRLKSREVFDDGLRREQHATWESDGFALADEYDKAASRYRGLVLPSKDQVTLSSSTVLVKPEVAVAQLVAEEAVGPRTPGPTPAPTPAPGPGPGPGPGLKPPVKTAVPNARFEGAVDLRPREDLMNQVVALAENILVHLQGADPDTFEIRVEVTADKLSGFDEWVVRTVRENARQLGFDTPRFEEL